MNTAPGFNLRLTEALESLRSMGNEAWVASKLRVSKSAVSQWKKDSTTSLAAANLYGLAQLSGYSPRWLLFAERPKLSSGSTGLGVSRELSQMIRNFQTLPNGVQGFIRLSIDNATEQQTQKKKAKV